MNHRHSHEMSRLASADNAGTENKGGSMSVVVICIKELNTVFKV